MLDELGYRLNVCLVVINNANEVVYCQRKGTNNWQFPQGGVNENEEILDAFYRELNEELGLNSNDIEVLGRTKSWRYYDFPKEKISYDKLPLAKGQKQIWYMAKLLASDDKIKLDTCKCPEFDDWKWVDYWYPLKNIVNFKMEVYQKCLEELHFLISK